MTRAFRLWTHGSAQTRDEKRGRTLVAAPLAGLPKEQDAPISQPGSSRDVSDGIVVIGEPDTLSLFYQSQGRLPSGQITNDCGPTNLAMALNLLAGSGDLTRQSVSPYLWRLGWPAPVSVRGATPPWSVASAFNHLAEARGLRWQAQRQHGTKEELIGALEKGCPSTIILVWEGGGAHYVTVVGYDPQPDVFLMLDPNPWYEENRPPEKRLGQMAWADLDGYWSRQVWWTRLLGIRNEMILYSPVQA
jgi:hypothetical protein